MNKMILAGIASIALAGAMASVPMAVSAKAVAPQLSTVDQAAATQLADSIVLTVLKVQAQVAGAPREQAKVQIQLAVQTVIRDSGASPIVAAAALEMARAKLAATGALACITNPTDKEESCNPAGMALAALSSLLQSILATTPSASGLAGGPLPLGGPMSMTPPNSGSSDYRGS